MKLKELRTRLLDLIYPPKCVFCQRVLDQGQGVCPKCYKELPLTQGAKIHVKGEFFSDCVSPLYYRDKVRDAVLRLKFNSKEIYAPTLGKIMAHCVKENLVEYDLITWVPVSKKRLRERGYDQSRLLAEAMGKELGMKPRQTLLKVVENKRQSSLTSKSERKANVLGVYEVVDQEFILGKTVLLVDDIITTGATMSECARCLLTAGAEKVVCAVFACK